LCGGGEAAKRAVFVSKGTSFSTLIKHLRGVGREKLSAVKSEEKSWGDGIG